MSLKYKIGVFLDKHHRNKYELKKFLVKDGKPHRFILVIPGGGFENCFTSYEGKDYAKRFNKEGYHAYVVYYRNKDLSFYPKPLEDISRAIHNIISRAIKDKVIIDNYIIVGSSIGGYLASMFSTKKICEDKYKLPRPSYLGLCYPVITMGELTHFGSRNRFLGEHPTINLQQEYSVELNIDKDYPKCYFFCGDADLIVKNENCELLRDALTKQNVNYVYRKFKDVGHGFGLGKGTNAEIWFNEFKDFIK